MDEIVTYSLNPESVASAAFFYFFANELPGMIRFAARKNSSGAPPRRKCKSLAVIPVAGHA